MSKTIEFILKVTKSNLKVNLNKYNEYRTTGNLDLMNYFEGKIDAYKRIIEFLEGLEQL